ncbi:MAG: AbrB/MazE/SpoVT family DNA-binding domain-containing protein [Patescibacteria group bacterium]|nr:AbrB/MazE/SpoVT family DNA-binding domain-containing protein [Patescibacteria group bacterium]
MNYLATITSKNQLTLPIVLFKKAGFRVGQKISVSEESGRLVLTPAEMLIEELAGSLKMPKKWKGKSLDRIIEESKKEYFKKNKFS